ncbi:helix-turn-helix transcriptional regulator [Peptoniphilus sp.]|jgi:AraC-like DNA-binding protein|uniref:helix-turn-helix transcriptional regulator n=1 Tax=Peptoniphilus sp. TaxID=1971214 RepID=UPI003D89E623
MTNYLNLAQLSRPDSVKRASEVFKHYTKDDSKNFLKFKKHIADLNSFLYTYFLITYNKDLVDLHKEFSLILENVKDIKSLESLAENIIKSYSETLLEKISFSDNEIVDEAIKIINDNFNRDINLKDVSETLHVSKNYLCSLFKEETGFTFCQYLNTLRTNMAKNLLKENKKTLEYISFACGFSSQPHFSMTFKKYTGLTPREYRLEFSKQ